MGDPRVPRLTVAGPQSGWGALCAALTADLPDFFGLAESNVAYARAADELPCLVGSVDDRAAGLAILRPTSDAATELHFIGVLRACQGMGLGGALVRAAEAHLRACGVRWFHVKTLGPSRPDEGYARTRAFYRAMGFDPLEELTQVWGPENPCLVMAKRL